MLAISLGFPVGAAEAAGSASQTDTAPAAAPTTNTLDLLRSFTHPTNPPMPRFEAWPKPPPPPPVTNAPAPATQVEKTPVAQAAGDKTLFSFRAENLEMKSALALFARANNLNIVPDLDVTGAVTLDVRGLSLERLMQALLEAHDLAWTEEGGLIRVRTTLTRMFFVDYLRLNRSGLGSSSATLSSGSVGGGGGGAGGSSGGAGASAGAGAGGGGAGGGGGGAVGSVGGSSISLVQANVTDFWKELKEELQKILTQRGRDSLAVNMTAGLIQITDTPSSLKKAADYLEKMSGSIQRQVDIEAKLYDVALNDQFQFGIDWERVVQASGQFTAFGAPTVIAPVGGSPVKPSSLILAFQNKNTTATLTALREQGEVTVISQPRLRTMNNQTAMIKVGQDRPFFFETTTFIPGTSSGTSTAVSQSGYQVVTVGTILSVTPQISSDGSIILDVSPVISNLVDVERSGSAGTNVVTTSAPVLDIKQASTLVRLHDGDTIVIGGLIQNSTAKTIRKIPVLGDIPWVGKLFQGKVNVKQKKELVIFLTPTVVH